MPLSTETFFTTVGCMDGRAQEPVIAFGRERFGAKFPDTITRAGLDGELPERVDDSNLLDSLKKKLEISLLMHSSQGIIVHGHEDCAGNPVDDDTHKDNIRSTISVLRTLLPKVVPIFGVYVKRNPMDQNQWVCEEVPETLMA